MDSGGYFKLWDISDVKEKSLYRANFRELCFIRAHKKGIAGGSVFLFEQNYYVATGSADKDVKLFTETGN